MSKNKFRIDKSTRSVRVNLSEDTITTIVKIITFRVNIIKTDKLAKDAELEAHRLVILN